MTFRARIADAVGELGNLVADRLGRVLYYGTLAAGATVTIPDLDYTLSPVDGDGLIFVNNGGAGQYQALINSSSQGVTWNNSTKVMGATGVGRSIIVISIRRTTPPAGGVGLRYIKNSNDEVIIDNLHENLEIIDEGSSAITGSIQTLTTFPRSGFPNSFLFLRWPELARVIVGSNGKILAYGATGNIDWKIGAMNPTTSRGTGSNPVMALYRGSDGVCTFSSRRKYARIRSIWAFDMEFTIDGGSGGVSGWAAKSGKSIPLNCFLAVQPTWRTGSSAQVLGRTNIAPATTDKNFVTFMSQLDGVSISGGDATSLGITTYGSYQGTWPGVTLILNP